MGNVFYFDWEISLMAWLQANLGGAGKQIAKIFSFLGGELVCVLAIVIILFCYRKDVGKRCMMAMIAASGWFSMAKNIALRVRPYMADTNPKIEAWETPEKDADLMDIKQQGYSFPSGHASMSLALYGSLGMEVRKRWMTFLCVTMVVLIGVSRFVVGVHFPTDVLAGWGVGLLSLGFAALLEKKVEKEWLRYVILLVTMLPGVFFCNSRDYFSALGMAIGVAIAVPCEAKYIQFQDTRNVWAMILRALGGMAIFYALDTVLKLPFSREWLNSGELLPNLVRTLRYAVLLIVLLGVYPRCFPLFEKIGRK